MEKKSLPPELVSLVHHVALNESGWWKKAIRRMIVALVWRSGKALSCSEISAALVQEYGFEISIPDLERHISALRSEGVLTPDSDPSTVKVSQAALRRFEQDLSKSESEANSARALFVDLLGRHCPKLDAPTTWEDFNGNFLLPMVRNLGANTYQLVVGETRIDDNQYLSAFLEKFPDTEEEGLRIALAEFLSPKNAATRAYILTHLNVFFLVEAARIPGGILEGIEKAQTKKPRFNLFLDTNVLFSILQLHDNPGDSSAETLLDLAQSVKEKVGLRFYVTPFTVEEARRVISAAANQLTNIGVPSNVAQAALGFRMSGLLAKYLEVSRTSGARINPREYFAPYIEGLVAILKEKGIELYGGPIQHMHMRQDVVDDVNSQLVRERVKPETKQKTYDAIQHDVTVWHIANDRRPNNLDSPLAAEDWVVTLDYSFLGFDQYKQKVLSKRVPICLHPLSLSQLLQFWVPMTLGVQESILSSLQLPLIFHDFSEEDENVTIRIVQTISRFEHAQDLPEDSIRSILIDKALRARIGENLPEESQIQLVRDALIRQHEKTKKQLEATEGELDELRAAKQKSQDKIQTLSTEIGTRDHKIDKLSSEGEKYRKELRELKDVLQREKSERESVSKRLDDMQAEAIKKSVLSRFTLVAIYTPLFVGLALTAVVYLALPGNIGSTLWQILFGLAMLLSIVWLFLFKQLGRRNKVISQWRVFAKLEKVASFIFAGLAVLLTIVIGIVVEEYWPVFEDWLSEVWTTVRENSSH